jgi:hypothetical protein
LVVRYAIQVGSRGDWALTERYASLSLHRARSLSQAVGPFGGVAGAVAME